MARERMAKLIKYCNFESNTVQIFINFDIIKIFGVISEHRPIVISAPRLHMKNWSSQQDPPHFDTPEKNVLSKLDVYISRTKRKRHAKLQICPLILLLQLAAQ